MKVRLTVVIEINEDEYGVNDDAERMWLENEILVGDGNLVLHSNDIGDTVGVVRKVTNIQWNYSS